MDFLGQILGADGCNVDGTTGRNPFTSMVEHAFESGFGDMGGGALGEAESVVFASEPIAVQSMEQVQVGQYAHAEQFNHSFNMFHQNQIGSNMPYMPGTMVPMQFPMFGTPPEMMGHYPDYEYEDEYEDEQYEEEMPTFEQYEDDGRVVGEEQEYDYQTDVGRFDDDQQHQQPLGPSHAGLSQAWADLQARLETGQLSGGLETSDTYVFADRQNNPYMSNSKPVDIAASMEQGMKLYQEGKIKEAILCFESVVQDPRGEELDEAWRMLGVCHAENDEDKRAIVCLNRCLDCDPYNLDALLALGTSYVNEQNSLKALETLRTWLEHNPRYLNLNYSAAEDAYSDGTQMDELTQMILAAIKHDPSDIEVKVLFGVLNNVSMDYQGAIDSFSEACAMRRDDYSLINKLAASYANSNRSEDAIPHYSRALQLRPFFARGWLNLGISFASLDRYEDAAKAYVQALHLNSDARHIWAYLRVVLSCMDRFDLVSLTNTEDINQLASSLNIQLLQNLE